jgi:hypothetical protein
MYPIEGDVNINGWVGSALVPTGKFGMIIAK